MPKPETTINPSDNQKTRDCEKAMSPPPKFPRPPYPVYEQRLPATH